LKTNVFRQKELDVKSALTQNDLDDQINELNGVIEKTKKKVKNLRRVLVTLKYGHFLFSRRFIVM